MVRPPDQLVQRVVHAAHDHIAGEEKRDRQPEGGGREQVPIVRVNVMGIAFANAEPMPVVRGSAHQDDDRIVPEVGTVSQFCNARLNGVPRERTIGVAGRTDHFRDGLDRNEGTFLKTQVPEGPLAPSSSAENDAGSTSVVR